jgi:hypothetical protein
MTSRRCVALTSVAALAVLAAAAAPASSQSSTRARAGFYGLIYTPAGALPPLLLARDVVDSTARGTVDVRYGRYRDRDDALTFNNIGLAASLRLLGRLRAGGVLGHRTCAGCEGLTMGGVEVAAPLLHRPALEPGAGDSEIGLVVSAGLARSNASQFTAQSVTGMLPLSVTIPQGNGALLMLTALPGLAYGRITDDSGVVLGTRASLGSIRFLFGANLSYLFPFRLGAHASVHRVAIRESTTQAGLGLSVRY